jgi:hypothetical protein
MQEIPRRRPTSTNSPPDGRRRRCERSRAVRAVLDRVGFARVAEVDLTARVPFGSPSTLRRRRGWLRLVRACAPMAWLRHVASAFLGGLALERLYARGSTRYRLWVGERREVPR